MSKLHHRVGDGSGFLIRRLGSWASYQLDAWATWYIGLVLGLMVLAISRDGAYRLDRHRAQEGFQYLVLGLNDRETIQIFVMGPRTPEMNFVRLYLPQPAQRAQYGLVKEHTVNHVGIPNMIQGVFFKCAIWGFPRITAHSRSPCTAL